MFKTPLVCLVLFIHSYQVHADMSPVLSVDELNSCHGTKDECKNVYYCDQVCKDLGCKKGYCQWSYNLCPYSPPDGPWACICKTCPPYEAETNITLSWGPNAFDMDLHAFAIPDNGSTPTQVFYANKYGPGISLDRDVIDFGYKGPEVDTLNDVTINKKIVYAIGVFKYDLSGQPDPDNSILLNSGAMVSVTNGRQPNEFSFLDPTGQNVTTPENWWFVGCVTVNSYGLFNLIRPSEETFFNGYSYAEWFSLATSICGAHPQPTTTDLIELPSKENN